MTKLSPADHYAMLLAPIYSWMVGDFEAACSRANDLYEDLGLEPGNERLAIDLGCGHGVHAIPLARRGYRVLGIDTSDHLLRELGENAGDLQVQGMKADLTHFTQFFRQDSVALIACMGDTLTHLPTLESVNRLIHDAGQSLAPGRLLTLSFRDYTERELTGTDRFLPVRSDSNRIHTCFLEYRPEIVIVHDLVHTRDDSDWKTSVSAYSKIRLAPDAVLTVAEAAGLTLTYRKTHRGMLYFAFSRSAHRPT